MEIPETLITGDRDRLFADWGKTITFREVTETYNPETQKIVESFTDTTLTAVVSEGESTPTAGTGAQHLTGVLRFLIKAEELPTPAAESTSRVLYGGAEYDVLRFRQSIQELVSTLECRKRT